jgi:RHS repeat-associated protein
MGSAGAARTFTLGYDWDGNLASITDPLARVTGFEHDAAGRILRKNLPDGRTIHFTYDADGNLTSVAPPGRPIHAFGFNAVDMVRQYAPPFLDASDWSTAYAYDLDHRLTAINRPDGAVVNLDYSSEGKLQTIATPDGNYSYTYNPISKHVEGIAAPGGEGLAFTYDGNLLLSQAWAGEVSGRIDRSFDNDFRITSRSVNGADAVAYGYDADGLLAQAGGLVVVRSAQNPLITGTTLGSITDTRGYNSFGEPAGYAAAHDATALLSFGYVRDKLGRIVEKAETVGGVSSVYSYSYDMAGRLAAVAKDGVPHESYTYDSNGNRLSGTTQAGTKSGTYDAQDRLLEYGGAVYTYTRNGDLETKTVGVQTTSYDYDALGNLRGVTLPGGTQITYVIDGLNRRVGKKVNGVLMQAFLYDNLLHPEAELDGSGNVISRFAYGTRSNVPDYIVKGGATYRIISDHLGSPRRVVDVSTGDVAQEMAYDSYGNVLSDNNPGFQPFGFAGGLYDQDTKLTRFGARDYDAQTGRWTAKDPIKFSGGDSNIYGYVLNDPVNAIDANGKIPAAIAVVVVAVATHPEIVVGVVTAVVNEVTGTSQPYDPETAKWEALATAVIKLVEEANETRNEYAALGEELDRLLEQVRKIREGAEMTREELERLLEELKRMFPCHKRGRR